MALKPEQQTLLATLRQAMEQFPELRLGQLIENVIGGDARPALYYISNDTLRMALLNYMMRA